MKWRNGTELSSFSTTTWSTTKRMIVMRPSSTVWRRSSVAWKTNTSTSTSKHPTHRSLPWRRGSFPLSDFVWPPWLSTVWDWRPNYQFICSCNSSFPGDGRLLIHSLIIPSVIKRAIFFIVEKKSSFLSKFWFLKIKIVQFLDRKKNCSGD